MAVAGSHLDRNWREGVVEDVLIARWDARSWLVAAGKALAIFIYFVLFTLWLPSWLLRLSPVAGAPAPVRELIGSGVWLVFFVAGMWALRRLQRKARI